MLKIFRVYNFRTVDYAFVPSVRIIEHSDNWSSDNREPTIAAKAMPLHNLPVSKGYDTQINRMPALRTKHLVNAAT